MQKPTIVERFTDNGEHSHYALIETETGELLWSEAPEEEIQQANNLNIPNVIKSVCECAMTSEVRKKFKGEKCFVCKKII